MTEKLLFKLDAGLDQMSLTLESEKKQKLITYLQLLFKWNKAYNLTAVRDLEDMVTLHLLDSLRVLPYISKTNLLDVGSGSGLPGVVLAICLPDLQVTTLDSNSKKTRFQLQVKAELNLHNLAVVHERVEKYQAVPFNQVISRAFASLQDMLNWTQHLCAKDGVFLAMKGQYPEAEMDALSTDFVLKSNHKFCLPSMDNERHLLVLERK